MAIAVIHEWLNGEKDYFSGLILYQQHGKSKKLKTLLAQKGDTKYCREKILHELTKLAGPADQYLSETPAPQTQSTTAPGQIPPAFVKEPVQGSTKDPVRHAGTLKPEVNIPGLPVVLQRKNVQKGKLFTGADKLHRKLKGMSQKDRHDAAIVILDSFDQINAIWKELDHFTETGQLPAPEKAKKADIAQLPMGELMKMRRNIPTYISKTKKKLLDAASDADRVTIEHRIFELNAEFNQVKEALGE